MPSVPTILRVSNSCTASEITLKLENQKHERMNKVSIIMNNACFASGGIGGMKRAVTALIILHLAGGSLCAVSTGSPAKAAGKGANTTHFSIIDAEGNLAGVTQTVNLAYGSGMVVDGGGFLLNDEMDDFDAAPGARNAFGLEGGELNLPAPGKRPKRVPPVPTPHDGTATTKDSALAWTARMSKPRRPSWRPRWS